MLVGLIVQLWPLNNANKDHCLNSLKLSLLPQFILKG